MGGEDKGLKNKKEGADAAGTDKVGTGDSGIEKNSVGEDKGLKNKKEGDDAADTQGMGGSGVAQQNGNRNVVTEHYNIFEDDDEISDEVLDEYDETFFHNMIDADLQTLSREIGLP